MEQCTEVSEEGKIKLLALFCKCESVFDGTLETWNTAPIKLELKPDAVPCHSKPFPVPHSQEQKLMDEIQRMVDAGVLRKKNDSEWVLQCSPSKSQMEL